MTTCLGPDPELLGLVADYFSKTFPSDIVTHAEHSGLASQYWSGAEELGLALIGIDESLGGSGGSIVDLVAVAEGVGRHTVPLPLVETSLAAWLLASAGVSVPNGPMTVIPDPSELSLNGSRLNGCAEHVPWARGADRVVAVIDGQVVSIDPSRLDLTAGTDLAGMPRDTLWANNIDVHIHRSDVNTDTLLLRGALLRSAQISGALAAALELTNRYVQQRVQFGKPIGAFQSVQAHVVELAEASALTDLCVQRAGIAAARGPATLEIIATKSVANRSAGLAVRAAHQAHGAIGMTREYPLQLVTRRLHTWRSDFGCEQVMNLRLGAAIESAGGVAGAATSVGSTIEV